MSIVIMLILISVLIVVHEFGHFLFARMFGVKVTRFAIGLPIGPVLFRKQLGETEFLIHAVLFGGYVAFLDDNEDGDEDIEEDGDVSEVVVKKEKVPLDSPLRFSNKKPYQQALILVAGVFMNFVFAIFLIMLTGIISHKMPKGLTKIYINGVVSENNKSNILEKDIKEGDLVLKINDRDVTTPYNFVFMVQKSKYHDGFSKKDTISRNLAELLRLNKGRYRFIPKGTIVKLPETKDEGMLKVSDEAYNGYERYKADEVEISDIAKELRNDVQYKKTYTVKEDNKITYENLAEALSDTYKPIKINLLRGNKEIVVNDIRTDENGVLNIKFRTEDLFYEIHSFKDLIVSSSDYAVRNTKTMCFGLWQIFTGKIPVSDLHGIVVITKVGGDVIQNEGIFNGLLLTALISIDLAIVNLLPIPALDGGHLLMLAIERIKRSKLDEKAVRNINNIFFFLLLALMLIILLNDVFALINKKF